MVVSPETNEVEATVEDGIENVGKAGVVVIVVVVEAVGNENPGLVVAALVVLTCGVKLNDNDAEAVVTGSDVGV